MYAIEIYFGERRVYILGIPPTWSGRLYDLLKFRLGTSDFNSIKNKLNWIL